MVEKTAVKLGQTRASEVVVLTKEQKEILARVCREMNILYNAKCNDYK